METPASDLFKLNGAETQILTSNAKKVTKGDLIGLHQTAYANPDLDADDVIAKYNKEKNKSITVEDLQSVSTAYQRSATRLAAASSVTACCCCCPCCSCTASVVIEPRVA
jgi:hypothetical protein